MAIHFKLLSAKWRWFCRGEMNFNYCCLIFLVVVYHLNCEGKLWSTWDSITDGKHFFEGWGCSGLLLLLLTLLLTLTLTLLTLLTLLLTLLLSYSDLQHGSFVHFFQLSANVWWSTPLDIAAEILPKRFFFKSSKLTINALSCFPNITCFGAIMKMDGDLSCWTAASMR